MALEKAEEQHIKLAFLEKMLKLMDNIKDIDEAVSVGQQIWHKPDEVDKKTSFEPCTFSKAKSANAIKRAKEIIADGQKEQQKTGKCPNSFQSALTVPGDEGTGSFQISAPVRILQSPETFGLNGLPFDFEEMIILAGVNYLLDTKVHGEGSKYQHIWETDAEAILILQKQFNRCKEEVISELAAAYKKSEGDKTPLFTINVTTQTRNEEPTSSQATGAPVNGDGVSIELNPLYKSCLGKKIKEYKDKINALEGDGVREKKEFSMRVKGITLHGRALPSLPIIEEGLNKAMETADSDKFHKAFSEYIGNVSSVNDNRLYPRITQMAKHFMERIKVLEAPETSKGNKVKPDKKEKSKSWSWNFKSVNKSNIEPAHKQELENCKSILKSIIVIRDVIRPRYKKLQKEGSLSNSYGGMYSAAPKQRLEKAKVDQTKKNKKINQELGEIFPTL